eukprot:6474903-Amphidinium_carterae.1
MVECTRYRVGRFHTLFRAWVHRAVCDVLRLGPHLQVLAAGLWAHSEGVQSLTGLYRSRERITRSQRDFNRHQRNWEKINDYYREVQRNIYCYQPIDLSSLLKFNRKMTPFNAIFKTYRCQAMVQAFEGYDDDQIATGLVFEGQEHLDASPAGGEREGERHYRNITSGASSAAVRRHRQQAQSPGSVGHSVAIEICHSIRIQNAYYRGRVIWGDPGARKRFKPDQRTGVETSKFAGHVVFGL